jgi:Putative MetA-pathway of phenol degradation
MALGTLCGAICLTATAENRDDWHLFNPTPRDQMREMSTDRPDTTESAYTVPAGHFQLEMSFFDYSRDLSPDPADSIRNQAWSFGLMNFKVGVTHNTDLQVIFDTYTQERSTTDEVTDKLSGLSDVTLRFKINMWGNDEGTTALSLMPYVKIPTGTRLSNNEWEGGLIVPVAVAINDRVNLGLMAQMDLVSDPNTGSYDFEWMQTATVGISLTEKLGMYVELVGVAGPSTDCRLLLDGGLTFSITENLVFDTGVRIGLNRAAEDIGVFTGMSFRY